MVGVEAKVAAGLVDDVEFLDELGAGGSGRVFKGYNRRLNRNVAVKVLDAVVDDTQREQFDAECQHHGPLSDHQHIVTVYRAGYTSNSHPYLEMEYVEQGSLLDFLEQHGPVPWRQAVEWMLPICDAVQTAHGQGILHRDLKPANILLSAGGPKLADFGIACLRDDDDPLHALSLQHAPPEALENRPDFRSDVYSLASTLFQLVAGKPPLTVLPTTDAVGAAQVISEAPVPRLPVASAPDWLNDLLTDALAKRPADRPQTMIDLAHRLRVGLAHSAVESADVRLGGAAVGASTSSSTSTGNDVGAVTGRSRPPFSGLVSTPMKPLRRSSVSLVASAILVAVLVVAALMALLADSTPVADDAAEPDQAENLPSSSRGTSRGAGSEDGSDQLAQSGRVADPSFGANVTPPAVEPVDGIAVESSTDSSPNSTIGTSLPDSSLPATSSPGTSAPGTSSPATSTPSDVTISDVAVAATVTTGRIIFTTDECSTARYLLDGGDRVHTAPGWPDASVRCWTAHGHTFIGLEPDTAYVAQVEVLTAEGAEAVVETIRFRTAPSSSSDPLLIVPPSGAEVVVGETNSWQLVARGGSGQFTWTGLVLPPGFSLDATGLLRLRPVAVGPYTVDVRVTDLVSQDSTGATFTVTAIASG